MYHIVSVKTLRPGAYEMAQRIRSFVAEPEGMNLIPETHMLGGGVKNSLPTNLPLTSMHTYHGLYRCVHTSIITITS